MHQLWSKLHAQFPEITVRIILKSAVRNYQKFCTQIHCS